MFYVYYLHSTSGVLLYIGRSINPIGRKASFERRTGITSFLGVCQRHSKLEDACKAEVQAIKKHRPPHNIYVASSPCRMGKVNKPEHNEAIRSALTGIKRSKETRLKISLAQVGRPRTPDSPEIKAKKSKGMTKNFYSYRGQKCSMKQLANLSGIEAGTLKYRINIAGWSVAKSLTTVVRG